LQFLRERFVKSEAEEYQRLTVLYRGMEDSELLTLSNEIDDLTPIAQQVLQTEISIRHLTTSAKTEAHIGDSNFDPSLPGSFAYLSSKHCVWEFPEIEDAQAAAEMLAAAGIKHDLVLPRLDTLDSGAPRLAVMPDDVERARRVLSQPIPEEFRIFVRTRDQFVTPTCSKCGSSEPLLESIEPTNKWRCEVCSNVWLDPAPAQSDATQTGK